MAEQQVTKQQAIINMLREPTTQNLMGLSEQPLTRDEILHYGLKGIATNHKLKVDYSLLRTMGNDNWYLYFDPNNLGTFSVMGKVFNQQKYLDTLWFRKTLIIGYRVHSDDFGYIYPETVLKWLEEGMYTHTYLAGLKVEGDVTQDDIDLVMKRHQQVIQLMPSYNSKVLDKLPTNLFRLKNYYNLIEVKSNRLSRYTGLNYHIPLVCLNDYAKTVSEPVTTFSELKTFIHQQVGSGNYTKTMINKTAYYLMNSLGMFLTSDDDWTNEFTFNQPLFVDDGLYTTQGIVHPTYLDDDFLDIPDGGTPLLDKQPDVKKYLANKLGGLSKKGLYTLVEESIETHNPGKYVPYTDKGNKYKTVHYLTLLTGWSDNT